MNWAVAMPAVVAAFLASLVEAVEALTIVLAVGTVRGWRPAGLGTLAGLLLLAVLVLLLGPVLNAVPLRLLQFSIGALLLLFGMRWLRKAILRAAGIIALHDEEKAYAAASGKLRGVTGPAPAVDRVALMTAFNAVVVEGIEVVFIVVAVGAGRGLVLPASAGAAAACVLVAALGFAVHQPLSRVPENLLKFAVGVMLSTFGIFWLGEGLGVPWPGEDLSIVMLAALLVCVSLGLVALARKRPVVEAAQ